MFRILTIDGGGIKGLYSATILKVIEKCFRARITDYFDLICGTSTGAIIAAGLAAGYSAEEVAQFYYEKGQKIFIKSKLPYWPFIKQLIVKTKYENTNLKSVLRLLLDNKKFKDSLVYLCIPTFDINTGRPYIFKTDHAKDLQRDKETFLWEAALASASAPTYFPVYISDSLIGHKFVDGGVWANNPSIIGLVEALKYFVGSGKGFDNFILVSLSSISEHFAEVKVNYRHKSILGWNRKLIDLFMAAQTTSSEQIVKFLTEVYNGEYLRIPSPLPSAEMIKRIKLDNVDKEVLDHIVAQGVTEANNLKNNHIIKTIFSSKKLTNQ